MTTKDIKQLIRLLEKFKAEKELDDARIATKDRDLRINAVIELVIKWVKWFGRDELNMDL